MLISDENLKKYKYFLYYWTIKNEKVKVSAVYVTISIIQLYGVISMTLVCLIIA